MMTKAAMAHGSIRTMGKGGRACPCCERMDHGRAKIIRRAQRRREGQAWRREAARDN